MMPRTKQRDRRTWCAARVRGEWSGEPDSNGPLHAFNVALLLLSYHRVSSSAFQYRYERQLSGVFLRPTVTRIAGVDPGFFGSRSNAMPASSGVRAPFRLLHVTHAVVMFVQSFFPPWATGTTWSNVSSSLSNLTPQY